MFCSKCGNQINSGAKFCNKCGEMVEQQNIKIGNQQLAINQVSNQQVNPDNPIHQEFGTPNENVNNNRFQSQTNSNASQNLNCNNQFIQNNQNNKKNFDIKKYLPFIIVGVLVLLVTIFVVNSLGQNQNKNDDFNNNGNNHGTNNNQDGKLNRNYKVSNPANDNSLKNLSFKDGEKYLRDIGFSEIEKGKFAYGNYDSYDYDGYTARNTVYKDDWYDDIVEIIFNNNQIFLCKINLVYLKDDMNLDTVYNDLSKLMSAFNGYKLDKAKLQSALTSAESNNDPDFTSKYGSEKYFIGTVGFDITVSISPETEYSKAKYTFDLRQGYSR